MNENNSNNIKTEDNELTLNHVPTEILARILAFTVGDDMKMLQNVKRTCPEWDNLTENICFMKNIFGESFRLALFLIEFTFRSVSLISALI